MTKTLFEVWKGHDIYHDRLSGLFSTPNSPFTSYVLSSVRHYAVNSYYWSK